MIRGFYTALSGVITAMTRQAVIADNIANVSTPGFKQSLVTDEDFELTLVRSTGGDLGQLGTGTLPTGLKLDQLMGALEQTGNPTDLAVEGDGLFVVETASGPAYTRAGNFVVDSTGTLSTQNGEPVLDTRGARIVLKGGASSFAVGQDGTISGTGQRLALVAWPASGVERLGGTLLTAPGPAVPGTGRIRQGELERSNVDLGQAMTNLITIQRSLSLSARALALQDETLADATQLGKLRS